MRVPSTDDPRPRMEGPNRPHRGGDSGRAGPAAQVDPMEMTFPHEGYSGAVGGRRRRSRIRRNQGSTPIQAPHPDTANAVSAVRSSAPRPVTTRTMQPELCASQPRESRPSVTAGKAGRLAGRWEPASWAGAPDGWRHGWPWEAGARPEEESDDKRNCVDVGTSLFIEIATDVVTPVSSVCGLQADGVALAVTPHRLSCTSSSSSSRLGLRLLSWPSCSRGLAR